MRVSGLPPPPFPVIDNTNTSSFPPKSQSQFATVVDAPQHDSEFILIQKHLNTSTIFPLAPQHKSATFTTLLVVCDFVAQSSTGTPTLARPMIVHPHAVSEPIFNILVDHCYTSESAFKLTGPPKFLNKKSSVPEESEKMVGKMKSAEYAMKNSQGPAGKENVSYRDWGMSSSVNPPPILEISKFEEQDGQEECKNKKDTVAIVIGERGTFKKTTSHPPTLQTYQSPFRPEIRSKPNNKMRKKSRDSFTPIGESYASLFQILVQWGMITPPLEYTPDPHLRSFDPNVRCAYHSNIQGHSIENSRSLKREIERIIQEKFIVAQNIGTSTIPQNSSSAHGTAKYVGSNELNMRTQNLFVEGNVSDCCGSSSHADMQTSG
ncbi:hypothetical protein P3S67_012524 [Capsicum chacoense]